jgi:hypothetical protein
MIAKKITALMFVMMISLLETATTCFADGGDSYSASNNQLLIPSITVGNTIYTNVVITINNIVSVGGQTLTNGVCVTTAPMTGFITEGGLTWMKVSSQSYTYTQAGALCAGNINGQTGWRLPTQPELLAFYAAYPNSSSTLTNQGWSLGATWSSTPGSTASTNYVVFLSQGLYVTVYGTYTAYVTCVH